MLPRVLFVFLSVHDSLAFRFYSHVSIVEFKKTIGFQVYILISRVTDPKNFYLIGVPPRDLIEDVAAALIAEGIDVDQFFENACKVTGEWDYDRSRARLLDRIQQKFCNERSVPLKFRTLAEVLNPQPEALVIIVRVVEAG